MKETEKKLWEILPACFLLAALVIVLPVTFPKGASADNPRSLKRNTITGEQRLALVIGNGGYANSPLTNPVNDAKDMAAVLKKTGFSVTLLTDTNQRKMEEAIQNLGAKLRAGGVGLFYFAGHGVQVHNINYLIPVDARIKSEADVRYEAVDANRILSQMEEAGNRMNLVFLDACRNNPYTRSFRSASQGLAQMDSPTGSMVAFATAPGSVAADGTGRNGIFTKYLIQAIQKPGVEIGRLMRSVRRNVQQETAGAQTPFELSSIVGDFYFTPRSDAPGATVVERPLKAGTGYSVNGEVELWQAVKESGELTDYEYFLKEYPDGSFAGIARLKIRKLRNAVMRSTLTVKTVPKDATIKFVNIREKYLPGMGLPPGSYTLNISAPGYSPRKKSITLPPSKEIVFSIVLPAVMPEPGDTYTDPATGMEFLFVKGGCYMMGCEPNSQYSAVSNERNMIAEIGDIPVWQWPLVVVAALLPVGCAGPYDHFESTGCFVNETPAHRVCLDDFWMGKYEVTQGEYKKIMGINPSYFKNGDSYPVENVSWNDAQEFISLLNRKTDTDYRLPTEAEWEYAARSGGKREEYAGGGGVDVLAWYGSNSGGSTHRVGTKRKNGLGLYDMSGNVFELCSDWYGENYYSSSSDNNPLGPSSGSSRVFRGGSWHDIPKSVRSALRGWLGLGYRGDSLGFRLVFPEDSRSSQVAGGEKVSLLVN